MPYRRFRRNLTASYFAPFIIMLSVLAAVLLWNFHRQASAMKQVEQSDQVILRIKTVEIELREMQSALRGYLLTGDRRYLADLVNARDAFAKNTTTLAALVADNAKEEDRLLEINHLKENWTTVAESLITQTPGAPFDKKAYADSQSEAQVLFEALESLSDAEYRRRSQRTAYQTSGYYVGTILIPILSAAVMAFLSFWGWREIQRATEEFRQALEMEEKARDAAETASVRAEKANRAKDTFIGTVSHELRTPLNSIMLWSAAILRDPEIGENVRRGMTAIERAVRSQAQLIEDLLDISRIESGRMRLDVQAVDLAEVVRAGVESMRVAAEVKSITLQEIIDPRVDSVAGDPGRLQQVVWNLVSNAVKFTPNGGKIQVRVERINSHIEIVVADTGRGIESAALASVFDRFWQADGPTQSKHGIGLGLSIVKEIVSLHGGTVIAQSEGPGKGSTFTVRLPLPVSTIPSLEARRHPTVVQMANAPGAKRLEGLSILVVDDDTDASEALKTLLGSLGAQVTAASSARAALTALDRMDFDAVISDIGMPVQDGYFLARELRRREQIKGRIGRVPLVALTAYGRVEDKVQILMAGFDSHAVKPVDPVELSAILESLIISRREMSSA